MARKKKEEEVIPDFLNHVGNLHVDCWKTRDIDIVQKNGKLVDVRFDKLFKSENITYFNSFVIKKTSYVDNMDRIINYINYFLEFYDTDKEILMSYFKLKHMIDKKDTHIGFLEFRSAVYSILFSDNIQNKIKQFVDDNYHLNIDDDPNSDKYSEQTRFNDQHTKILLRASMAIKIMVPVVFHYINSENLNMPTKLYQMYEKTLEMFTEDGIDMYNKLWIWIKIKTQSDFKSNQIMWEQRAVYGADPSISMSKLYQRNFMIDTLYKYQFVKNPIKLNNVVINSQLKFANKTKYKHNLVEVTSETGGGEGVLTRIDKMMMNSVKIDESIIVTSERNVKSTLEKLKNKVGNLISDEEYEFYYKNHQIDSLQMTLVNYYYAKLFNGFTDLNTLTRRQYITLMVIMKKQLLIRKNFFLPQIISGNIEGKTSNRLIQSNKFISKLEVDPLYQDLMENKFKAIKGTMYEKHMLSLLSSMLNTKIKYVDYNSSELTGEEINVDADVLSGEYLVFLNNL